MAKGNYHYQLVFTSVTDYSRHKIFSRFLFLYVNWWWLPFFCGYYERIFLGKIKRENRFDDGGRLTFTSYIFERRNIILSLISYQHHIINEKQSCILLFQLSQLVPRLLTFLIPICPVDVLLFIIANIIKHCKNFKNSVKYGW